MKRTLSPLVAALLVAALAGAPAWAQSRQQQGQSGQGQGTNPNTYQGGSQGGTTYPGGDQGGTTTYPGGQNPYSGQNGRNPAASTGGMDMGPAMAQMDLMGPGMAEDLMCNGVMGQRMMDMDNRPGMQGQMGQMGGQGQSGSDQYGNQPGTSGNQGQYGANQNQTGMDRSRMAESREMARLQSLGLTDQQLTQIRQIRASTEQRVMPERQQLRAREQELRQQLIDPSIDRTQIDQTLSQISSIRNTLATTWVDGLVRARAVLTPDQFQRLISSSNWNGGMNGMNGSRYGREGMGRQGGTGNQGGTGTDQDNNGSQRGTR